jgi:hypothetical protein
MNLNPGFSYQPTTPAVPTTPPGAPSTPPSTTPPSVPPPQLGALAGLIGNWAGSGFNAIWRPNQPATGSDRFLELNLTTEILEFDPIPGKIPNRGLLQGDLFMAGLRYLQQISDSNVIDPATNRNAGLHIEPGLWLSIPATTDPIIPASVARLASIPHGTTIVAQGLMQTAAGAPTINPVSITPFKIGNPQSPVTFPEQTLTSSTSFRTTVPGLNGISQAMLDNPNSVLTQATAGISVATTTTLTVSSVGTPILGGGTANTAFLQGGPDGPNADAARVDSTFWLMTTQGSPQPDLLQYSQVVLLNFNGLSWPHVTVGTLRPEPTP